MYRGLWLGLIAQQFAWLDISTVIEIGG